MREVDFLPGWYRQSLRHRRVILWQGGVTIAIGLGIFVGMLLMHHRVESAKAGLQATQNGLIDETARLKEMDQLGDRRKQWLVQEQIMARLGLQVEAARLMRALDTAMPQEVSLVGLQFDAEEPAKSAGHRLRIRLQGVAPTDSDLATFMTRLGELPVFEQVTAGYVKEFSENGHLLRSFEVSFSMSLNAPI